MVSGPPLAERRHALRRESVRDFLAVAAGVSAGAVVWGVFHVFVRLQP